ncbi:MAG: hypothetical protein A2V66_07065 [Ignavibacteria bacterium RBG_13_36_8]|nr:MAG: hypothetical protein A2V66_07065 [Ignavibacteria bacterium RBG_13_36_8]
MNTGTLETDKKSYKQILKSTSIMGGSQVITIFLRIIRTKVLAVILGPTGVGLIGIYDSITSLAGIAAGLGIGTSGVRQIAEAFSTGDQEKISRTITCLRRIALISGAAGLMILLLLSWPISQLTFNDTKHARDIALLSITILFSAISGGQTALIQGMRRIRDLAKLSILGAFLGTVVSIPIVYVWGEKGIVLFLIVVSAMSIVTSWWYSRKIKVQNVALTWKDIIFEAKPLLRLGFVFMMTGLMTAGSMYLLRVIVVRYLGLGAAGMYQAATTLSALYVGFILDAMGRDFYPQLTAIAQDNLACTSLVNKQIEVGLLLALPGILATMTLAPVVINIFYSAKFLPAYDVLRWQMLGIALRIISWPMGFLLIAKGNGRAFFWTELISISIHLVLIYIGVKFFGLTGTGMAFFVMYCFYGVMMYRVIRGYYGFSLSLINIRIGAIAFVTMGIIFLTPYLISNTWSIFVNMGVTVLIGLYSAKKLYSIVGPQAISNFLFKIKLRFRKKG